MKIFYSLVFLALFITAGQANSFIKNPFTCEQTFALNQKLLATTNGSITVDTIFGPNTLACLNVNSIIPPASMTAQDFKDIQAITPLNNLFTPSNLNSYCQNINRWPTATSSSPSNYYYQLKNAIQKEFSIEFNINSATGCYCIHENAHGKLIPLEC